MSQIKAVGGPTVAATWEPPATLGSYTLLTKIARGGMATVYVGNKHGVAGFERLIAIKCCHPHLLEDQEFVTMFLDEARLAARIHHPNVVATLDVGCTDILYLIMEYVEGDSLVGLLRHAKHSGAPLPLPITVRILIDALTGLHAAHELCGSDGQPLNLVHRDVSPQNILVGVDGVSRITDFGIACAAARSTVTKDGRIKGKFSYMAPEQVKGGDATRRIDIFAAGVVLWEALTGQSLFRGKDDIATINAVLSQEKVPAPSTVAPHLPAALDPIVLKALERDPEQRYQSAAEFADALEQLDIERATTRAVAAYVDTALGELLAARRVLVRAASEQGHSPSSTGMDESEVRRRLLGITDEQPATFNERATVPDDDVLIDVPTSVAPPPHPVVVAEELEHRRMRGLLAAFMLLLVGSAVGLLLARMSTTNSAQATPPASAQPAGSRTPARK